MCVCEVLSVCVCVYLGGLRLEGNQAGRGVCQDVEVGGGRRAHGCGATLRVHLVVDQPPLLQEGMDPAWTHPTQINTLHHLHFNRGNHCAASDGQQESPVPEVAQK